MNIKMCLLNKYILRIVTGRPELQCQNEGVISEIFQQALMDVVKTAVGHYQDHVARPGGGY